jgi:hypothetical protein
MLYWKVPEVNVMYDLVGKTLGKYQIIERLHQTAVTEVYKGFNPGMNRYVVVNVLKAEFY